MSDEKLIYWHRELPPLSEQVEGEHAVQAASDWVPYTLCTRDELWAACHGNLMAHVSERIAQEIRRLQGSCAHILEEDIKPKVDNTAGRYRLEGTFSYVLYRHPASAAAGGTTKETLAR
jgi:hypothetical protein